MKLVELFDALNENNGFTVNGALDQVSTDQGYAVSYDRNETRVKRSFLTLEMFEAVIALYQDESKGAFIGAWYDADTDEICFDVSQIVQDRETAIRLAKHYQQKAIFDFSTKTAINL